MIRAWTPKIPVSTLGLGMLGMPITYAGHLVSLVPLLSPSCLLLTQAQAERSHNHFLLAQSLIPNTSHSFQVHKAVPSTSVRSLTADTCTNNDHNNTRDNTTTHTMLSLFRLLYAIFALLLPLTLAQSVLEKHCVHKGVHVIVTSGYGSSNVNGYGLLSTLKDKILKQIPGSTDASVTYDKGDETKYLQNMDSGTESTKRYIRQYVKSCPRSKIVLLGYSAVSGLPSTSRASHHP